MNDQMQQPTPAVVQQTTVIHVGNRKSVAGAVLLAFFFGPLGMIYSTVTGALVMFFVNILVAIPTLGLGLFLTIPLGAVWAGISAHNHNENLGATQAVTSSAATAANAAPAGWHRDPEGSDRLRYWDGVRWTDSYASTSDGEGPTSPAGEDSAPALVAATGQGEGSTGDEQQPTVTEQRPTETGTKQPAATATAEETAVMSSKDDASAEGNEARAAFCEACGQPVGAADRFCPTCGAQQQPVG